MSSLANFLEIFPETWKNSNGYYLRIGEGLMLDPGMNKPKSFTEPLGLVLATHGHYDHLAGIDSWLEQHEARFVFPEKDLYMLLDEEANASRMFAHARTFPQPDQLIRDGDSLELSSEFSLECWETPGHTRGSSCFLLRLREGKTARPLAFFSGDTFFADSVGRSDFEGGDPRAMRASVEVLRLRFSALPAELPIFPGHGSACTVEKVLRNNPFFREGGYFAF